MQAILKKILHFLLSLFVPETCETMVLVVLILTTTRLNPAVQTCAYTQSLFEGTMLVYILLIFSKLEYDIWVRKLFKFVFYFPSSQSICSSITALLPAHVLEGPFKLAHIRSLYSKVRHLYVSCLFSSNWCLAFRLETSLNLSSLFRPVKPYACLLLNVHFVALHIYILPAFPFNLSVILWIVSCLHTGWVVYDVWGRQLFVFVFFFPSSRTICASRTCPHAAISTSGFPF